MGANGGGRGATDKKGGRATEGDVVWRVEEGGSRDRDGSTEVGRSRRNDAEMVESLF